MHLNLIWAQTPQPLWETNWIRWLFQNFQIVEHVAPKFDLFRDNSVYILSNPLSQLPSWFLDGIKRIHGKGLFHLADESFAGGYEIYSSFDFVLRNYHSTIFNNDGIRTLPLGFTSNTASQSQIPSLAERKFLWSFAGAKTAARVDMFRNLQKVEPHKCYLFDSRKHPRSKRLEREKFMALLSDSVFSPCPMGNTVLETFRLYESLEMGCIPILERRRWMPYYDRLMPDHPLPTFLSWRKARQFVQAVSRDGPRMIAYQQEIAKWWRSYKVKLRTDVTAFVSLGLEGSFRSSLRHWHYRSGVNHQVWRLAELLKHSNYASLGERIGITARRLIDRMVVSR